MHRAKEDLLVLAAQGGNEQAFAYLCRYYQTPLLRFAFKLCDNHQVAQDAVQEAWIKVSRKLNTLNDPRAFKSWVFRAVRWSVYDSMRKLSRENDLIQYEDKIEIEEPEEEGSNHDELLSLIEQLPEIDKQAIYLFYLEGMKISEIANVLDIPKGTVKSRLNRARNNIREQANL